LDGFAGGYFFLRDVDLEGLLDVEGDFPDVQGIGTEVFGDAGVELDVLFVDDEGFEEDGFELG
jgi:hypothetical protein